jgi:hypothetical protein
MWEPRCFTNLWVSTACYRDSFTFLFTFLIQITLSNNWNMGSIAFKLQRSSNRPVWFRTPICFQWYITAYKYWKRMIGSAPLANPFSWLMNQLQETTTIPNEIISNSVILAEYPHVSKHSSSYVTELCRHLFCNEIIPASHWNRRQDDVIRFLQCMPVNTSYKYLRITSLLLHDSNLA